LKGREAIPFPAACPRIGHIREYPVGSFAERANNSHEMSLDVNKSTKDRLASI